MTLGRRRPSGAERAQYTAGHMTQLDDGYQRVQKQESPALALLGFERKDSQQRTAAASGGIPGLRQSTVGGPGSIFHAMVRGQMPTFATGAESAQYIAGHVKQLHDSDPRVQAQAAQALALLAFKRKDSQQPIAAAPDAIPGLGQLLHSSSPTGKLYAAATLASVAACGNHVQQLIAAAPGIIPGLVQLLLSSDTQHVAAATAALANLAGDGKQIQQQIASAPGTITKLKQLLGSSDQDVQQLLSSLSSMQAVQALIKQMSGTAQHVMPGGSGAPEPQQSALDGGTADRPCYKDSLGELRHSAATTAQCHGLICWSIHRMNLQ